MGWIVTLVTCFLSIGLIVVGKIFAGRQLVGLASAEKDRLIKQMDEVMKQIEGCSKDTANFISAAQFETLVSQVETAVSMLKKEKETLATIESSLDTAQKSVEEKESAQQELKTSKEEEESVLEELLGNYTGIAEESTQLEHQLAESLKSLDNIMAELELTEDQRGLLDELSKALTSAGSNLRDLLMEYEAVKTRLENLRQQHLDLEEEYTKLVEQQLGE